MHDESVTIGDDLIRAFEEELAQRDAENASLQCQLAAERMIARQIFAALEAVDPQMQGAVLGSLLGIAAELESRADQHVQRNDETLAKALQVISACIERFTESIGSGRKSTRDYLHLVVSNPAQL